MFEVVSHKSNTSLCYNFRNIKLENVNKNEIKLFDLYQFNKRFL